jgi:hypothetical protein
MWNRCMTDASIPKMGNRCMTDTFIPHLKGAGPKVTGRSGWTAVRAGRLVSLLNPKQPRRPERPPGASRVAPAASPSQGLDLPRRETLPPGTQGQPAT